MAAIKPIRCASTRAVVPLLAVLGLSIALAACGGGGDQAGNTEIQTGAQAEPASAGETPVALESKAKALSVSSDRLREIEAAGLRRDVADWLATLGATDPQRATLVQAARVLQSTLTLELGRRGDLQRVVDGLAAAQACIRIHYPEDTELWKTLEARTYNTWARRIQHISFRFASKLFARWPSNATCPVPAQASGGNGGAGAGSNVPPPPPMPPLPPPHSASQSLAQEIARLEQQGVLPVLDRSTDIQGPDADNNGVRDDIDKFIAVLTLTDAQRRAAFQTARVEQQKLLADLSDKAAIRRLSNASMASTSCFGDTFEPDRRQSYKLSAKIEAITANTPERAMRAIKFMGAVSGTVIDFPEGNTCE